ncbi:hypothetical protein NHP190012_11320 [Helicobacter sp. NHP19-012]|uniref:Uncharacterized protein n=1 Tax=Helicobacter gastrofelis TaxID=2849642 RepID=A0ABM7SPF2_9HELI|nr:MULTISPECIES: DUF1104 domain-containing protein [unclassified Helicobacter]BCZ19490.1 hypothetical protein NHP190012_11320 [Helicobacter sp. NHP19-012]GMB96860.1 hypothetical protein NHP22001_14490 [Helicobacter sp. NHP22-001]
MQSFKLGISTLIFAGLCTTLSASTKEVSYQNTNDTDLIKLAGKISPKEEPDYAMELHKRAEKMNPKQRKEFYREVIATADKNIANAVMENISKRMDELSAWQSKLELPR